MWLQTLIKFLFGNKHFTGLLPDTRPSYEKERDYAHEEREVTAPTNPFGNTQITDSPYPYENQNQTFSCVSHGVGLGLAIERRADTGLYARLSWIFNYRLRPNFAAEGCYLQSQFDMYRKYGAPMYATLPTPYTEVLANSLSLTQAQYNEGDIYKGLEYWTVKSKFNDIDTLAALAQQGHGIAILIYGTQDEWAQDYPTIQDVKLSSSNAEIRHCVCILPYSGFTKDSKKYLTVQDSAWFGGKKLRHLSEDWITARVYGAAYWDTVATIGNGPAPKYKFTKPLAIGATGEEVRQMQLLLISQGLLPNDCATGYFGGKTQTAVKAFQNRYSVDILIPAGLTSPTGFWGPFSINKANALCA